MRVILIAFVFFVAGCKNHQNNSNGLEQLQNIFGTANWQVVSGTDTSYVFFSLQANNFKVYQYNLFEGDSANTEMGSIIESDGEVQWKFLNKTLVLDNVRENETTWKDSIKGIYFLTRKTDSLMQMKTPNGNLQFKKTLPLSTFLVRAKYDYEHESKLTDSSEIKPKKSAYY
jgi:hypothetical protein